MDDTNLGPFCGALDINVNNINEKLPQLQSSQLTNGVILEINQRIKQKKDLKWINLAPALETVLKQNNISNQLTADVAGIDAVLKF